MKGVLICGGTGSRLRPLTDVVNKSLLPVYDKPLILFPLEILLKAGITDIAIITGSEHMDQMMNYLGSGSRFGCSFTFKQQEKPGGIAQALALTEDFCDGENLCAVLGDNVFLDDLTPAIKNFTHGAHSFLKEVPDPERFGVATVVQDGANIRVTSIEEKPLQPKSSFAITGCYLYDHRCFGFIREQKPSSRGELEITDVTKCYMEEGTLTASVLQRDWVDAGTFESLYRASGMIRDERMSVIAKAKDAALEQTVHTPTYSA